MLLKINNKKRQKKKKKNKENTKIQEKYKLKWGELILYY